MSDQKKNRILVYNDSFFITSQTFIYYQVQSLSEKYEVDLLGLKFVNPHGYEIDSFRTHEISLPKNTFEKAVSKMYRESFNSPLNLNPRSYVRLRKLFKKNSYSAIHAHFGYNGLNILKHAKKCRLPLVVTFHGYDASRMLSDETYKNRLPELFEYASAIILVSRHMIDNLNLERWLDKVKIIPCTVDPDVFEIRRENSTNGIKILHSGRLVDKKGVPDLIKVFRNLRRRYDNIELHIVGDGKKLERCKELVQKFKLDKNVTFYGAVSHDDVKNILSKADIFVLNSRVGDDGDMEGTPVTLLEAMCSKVPVISTRHAGIPDVIEDGVNGLLVDERDNEGLEDALSTFIENPELRQNCAENARNTVLKEYTVDRMKEKLIQVFQSQ
jgi:glycosyltransferase involved in cell wall biosynthesis